MKLSRITRSFTAIALSAALAAAMSVPVAAARYADVAGRPDETLIEAWSGAGVLTGAPAFMFGPEVFRPDDPLTRAELAESLYAIFRNKWTVRAENSFEDIYGTPAAKVSYKGVNAILHAAAADVVTGELTAMGRFVRPLAQVTREEAAVMLARSFGLAPDAPLGAADSGAVARYAVPAVAAVIESGYMPVDASGSFNPRSGVTRAEILAVYDAMAADYPELAAVKASDAAFEYTDISVGKSPIADSRFSAIDLSKGFVPEFATDDFTYAENREKDISIRFYKPLDPTGHDPLMIYVFGGAWVLGDNSAVQSQSFDLLEHCLRNGIAVASLSYSLSFEAAYPQPLHELKAQIRYLRANAEELGIDPDNFGVAGASAGGYWANMLAVTGDSPEHEGELFGNEGVSSKLKWALDMFGMGDMFTMFPEVDPYIQGPGEATYMHDLPVAAEAMLFGLNRYKSGAYPAGVSMAELRGVNKSGDASHELWSLVELVRSGSPIYNVDKDDPAFMIYHGTQDNLVPVYQDIEFYSSLKNAGVPATILIAAYTGHELLHPKHELTIYDWVVEQAGK
ncbi:MAG: S-layer homology domain-containing protein [Oscillospiraceae bacterium]|nr:S-layer homology domain-containing protein [Oscillospiraceae bacterium]